MEISIKEQDDVTIVSVAGSVDALTADLLLEALQGQIANGRTKMVGDLEAVEYTSSAGLRAILTALKDTRSKGGDLRLAAVQKNVNKVFELSGFSSILKIFPDVSEAVTSFSD